MILKASQRGGSKQLALHLLNTADNEHVTLHELRGFVSDDLTGAMKETYAISKGTRCKQFLFSVSLNPLEHEDVPVEVFENAIDRIEERNGLNGQPRAIVFHEKEGRRHAHAVWSRIDAETMTARNLPHFKLKLRDISKGLYLENDWRMPKGLMDHKRADPRNYSLTEHQQAKRIKRDARDLKAMMQECWAASDNRQSFAAALEERGMILAKGRRGHIAITHEGEPLSIARYVGKNAKEVRAKLGEADDLPSADDAAQRMASDMMQARIRQLEEAKQHHQQATAPLKAERDKMTAAHQAERLSLQQKQQARWQAETKARSQRLNTGLKGLWDRFTGQRAQTQRQNEIEALQALNRDNEQRQALIEAQLVERRELQECINRERRRHAQTLADLHKDRKRYEDTEKSIGPPKRNPSKHAAEFNRHAAATNKERLAKLRSGNTPRPELGPDRER